MPVYRLTCIDRKTGGERPCLLWAHDDAKARKRADDKGLRVSSVREATELDLSDPICQWIGTPTKAVSRSESQPKACVTTSPPVQAPEGRPRSSRLEQIEQQIKRLGQVDTFGTKKEIKHLPEVLSPDETVLALTSGLMDGNTWLIVCTERRVIFLDKGLLYGLKQRETPLEKINSIEQKTGMLLGSIGIWDGAARMEIRNVMKQTVGPFVQAVNRAREAVRQHTHFNGPRPTPVPNVDVASQLERLAELRERGILTDAEFAAQKAKLLG